MIEKRTKKYLRCTCDICGYKWDSESNAIPIQCAGCFRRTWNGADLRRNLFITVNGKTQRLCNWAKESGIAGQLIRWRIKKGWSEKDAVTVPAGGRREKADAKS